MFKILSARGCYSHHLVNTLAAATSVTTIDNFFNLSTAGDSHSIRDNQEIVSNFSMEHFKHLFVPPVLGEQYILIEPSRMHVLEYLDNSFTKESNYQFNDWFKERMINRELIPESHFLEILDFLESNDISTGNVRTLAPENNVWMLREMLSYKIDNIMFSCYERYFMLNHYAKIKTTDFFDNFESAFTLLVATLGLSLKKPMSEIIEHNNKFVKGQKFYNIQTKCNQYVDAVVTRSSMESPCITIFDEAYIQSQLRHLGWEIKVDNLDQLPNAIDLSDMIYPAHLKLS